jgi:hypothetical protein
VAADLWSATEILIPAFIANGYTAPWPSPSADPGDPSSAFRNYLDNSMDRLLSAGINVTNDPDRIHAVTWDGTTPLALFVDGFESGDTAGWSATTP